MNLIFQLSQALDFRPLYSDPIPPELFPLRGQSLFDAQRKTFVEFFPDMFPIVVESGEKPVFEQFNQDLDFLHIPNTPLPTFLFLWVAIATAEELDSLSLIYPANLYSINETFFRQVRELLKGKLPQASLLFWGSPDLQGDFSLIRGEKVASLDKEALYRMQAIDQDFQDENALGFLGPVFCHHQNFLNAISRLDKDLLDLFYLLVDNWKNSEVLGHYFQDVVLEVNKRFSLESINHLDDAFTLSLSSISDKMKDYVSLMNSVSKDSFGNVVEGDFDLFGTSGSLLVNQSSRKIEISDLHEVCCFANESEIRFCSLDR